uniref:Uncharacterized protein n=1 Tax=Amphimedon queenslandica TaxID=400682 RepID=A0A1X7VMS1_AMPQE
MNAITNMFCLLLLVLQSSKCSAQQCTERFMDLSLVKYRAEHIGSESEGYILREETIILQEYRFNCSYTRITHLILGIDVRSSLTFQLFPKVQILRSRKRSSLQYDVVSERVIYYSTTNVSTSGVFAYPFNPPIPVMRGDLLAVSQPDRKNSTVRIFAISNNRYTFNSKVLGCTDDDHCIKTKHFILVYPVTDDYCVKSLNSIKPTDVIENALKIHHSEVIQEMRQYIYPEIKFSCSGSVTKWIFGATYDLSQDPNWLVNTKLPELQIWKKLSRSMYVKKGSSLLKPNAIRSIGNNLYEHIPQNPLEFNKGDLFGIQIPEKSQIELYEQKTSGPANLMIQAKYAPSTIENKIFHMYENDFPLVTVEISPSRSIYASSKIHLTSIESYFTMSTRNLLFSSENLISSHSTKPTIPSTNIPPDNNHAGKSGVAVAVVSIMCITCSIIAFLVILAIVFGCIVSSRKRRNSIGIDLSTVSQENTENIYEMQEAFQLKA